MADSFIQLPADSTGKKVDTRTEGTNSEHREVHIIGDPSANEGLAVVTNADPTGEIYGVVVRDPNTTTIASNTTNIATLKFGTGYQDQALRTVQATDSVSSVIVNSGTINTVTTVTGVTNTVNVRLDSTDGVYTIANPFPVTIASGALTSTIAVGDTLHDTADIGAAPIKVGGVAMTTNPTAVADGDRVNFRGDDLGRQLTRLQARDLVLTAYVSITSGTETTLLAAVAGSYLDLIMITATNNSTAATQLDVRAVTTGNIIHTMYLPAQTGPVGWTPPVPWPQDATGNNWTIDMPDQTGTTVYVSALFSKEV